MFNKSTKVFFVFFLFLLNYFYFLNLDVFSGMPQRGRIKGIVDFQSSEIKVNYFEIKIKLTNLKTNKQEEILLSPDFSFELEVEAGQYDIQGIFLTNKKYFFRKRSVVNIFQGDIKLVTLLPIFGNEKDKSIQSNRHRIFYVDFLYPEFGNSQISIWSSKEFVKENVRIYSNALVTIDSVTFYSDTLFVKKISDWEYAFWGDISVEDNLKSSIFYCVKVNFIKKVEYKFF